MRKKQRTAVIILLAGAACLAPAGMAAADPVEQEITPTYVQTSSVLYEPGYDHGGWNVYDYDMTTAWSEGANGQGIGEYIILGVPDGSTITGGISRGMRRSSAVKLSFLMSIPAILGANILDIPDMLENPAAASDARQGGARHE